MRMRLIMALEINCLSCNEMHVFINQQLKVFKIALAFYVSVAM